MSYKNLTNKDYKVTVKCSKELDLKTNTLLAYLQRSLKGFLESKNFFKKYKKFS